MKKRSSQVSGFYNLSVEERGKIVSEFADIDNFETKLAPKVADKMIENYVANFELPMGIAPNFLINGKSYFVPMVTEEPSVVAAASKAAKLFAENGGFKSWADEPVMTGQIQIMDIDDPNQTAKYILERKAEILEEVDRLNPKMKERGGGAKDIEVKVFQETVIGNMLIVNVYYDVREAMGANAINTAMESVAPIVEKISGGRSNLKILSNLSMRRKAYATGTISSDSISKKTKKHILEAFVFAQLDHERAATHNKGVMNGIDAVVVATGNDWRAVEAGAHSCAARNGSYNSLTKWRVNENSALEGSIELPLAVGTVGGAVTISPGSKLAMKILGNPSSRELAGIIATVGLAQNFAALYALSTEGIQKGHMPLARK